MRFGTENNRSGERGSGAARRAGLSGGRILFVLLALAVAFAVTGGQGTALAKEKSLDELNSEIQEKQKALEEGKQQEEELLSVIVDLEEEIDQLQGEIAVGEENLAVLEDDLEKTDAEALETKEYYWGGVDEKRVELSRGRDLTLSPAQDAGDLNDFGYPYAEVDGEIVDFYHPADFVYTISFTED